MIDFRFRKWIGPGDRYQVRIPGNPALARCINTKTEAGKHQGARTLATEWMHLCDANEVELWEAQTGSDGKFSSVWYRVAWQTKITDWEFPDLNQDWDIT